MRNIDAVVFNLYGTLIHLKNDRKPYALLAKDIGLSSKDDNTRFYRYALTTDSSDIHRFVSGFIPGIEVDAEKYRRIILDDINSAYMLPNTKTTIEDLKSKGLRVGMISNLATPYKEPFFRFGLDQLFDETILSCDEKAGMIKPDMRIYLGIAARLNVRPNKILFIGDSYRNDFRGPIIAGMTAMLINYDSNHGVKNAVGSYRICDVPSFIKENCRIGR